MKQVLFALVVLLHLVAPVAGQDVWHVDQICLANWSEDPNWYPARIVSAEGADGYAVLFFDGSNESLSADALRSEQLGVGDWVEAAYQRDPQNGFYRAKILARRGMVVDLQYADDEKETTTMAFIRWRPGLEGEGDLVR